MNFQLYAYVAVAIISTITIATAFTKICSDVRIKSIKQNKHFDEFMEFSQKVKRSE